MELLFKSRAARRSRSRPHAGRRWGCPGDRGCSSDGAEGGLAGRPAFQMAEGRRSPRKRSPPQVRRRCAEFDRLQWRGERVARKTIAFSGGAGALREIRSPSGSVRPPLRRPDPLLTGLSRRRGSRCRGQVDPESNVLRKEIIPAGTTASPLAGGRRASGPNR